jgi:hypothetical protein
MCVSKIFIGRERAGEILNMINPDDAEFYYGPRNGGPGYSAFRFEKHGNNYIGTVRTADRDFVKLDGRMLDTNIAAAEEYDMEHVLFLGFNWMTSRTLLAVRNCEKYIDHFTKGRNYSVFRKHPLLCAALRGDENVRLLCCA